MKSINSNILSENNTKTVYVSNNGLDSNDGSYDHPYKTLGYAFNNTLNSKDIDSIYLYNGSYNYNSSYYFNKSISITGESRNSMIVLNNNTLITTNNSINLSHLSIVNGSGTYGSVIKIKNNNISIYLDDVVCSNNTGNKGSVIGNVYDNCKIIISNSEFSDNTATNMGGVFCFSGYNNYINITNCSFINNYVNNLKTSFNYGCGGAIYNGGCSTLNINNCSFRKNYGYNGGAIYNAKLSNLIINSSIFDSNYAQVNNSYGYGGAIMIGNGELKLDNSTFINNTAYRGGAISLNSGTDIQINNSRFYENNAEEYGGAIYVYANVNISNCDFTHNSALIRGGAMYDMGEGDKISINNSNFMSNLASSTSSYGGAFAGNAIMSEYIFSNVTFINNTASTGGSISSISSGIIWTITDVSFINNTAYNTNSSFGGAIYIKSNDTIVKIDNSILMNNNAMGNISFGGAIMIDSDDVILRINNNQILNNSAKNGGAIYVTKNNSVYILSSILNGNIATDNESHGGAIYSRSQLYALSNMFINNNATYGGAIYIRDSTADILSSVLYNNTNNIYSRDYLIDAQQNWWGTNDVNLIKSSNSYVNDSQPVMFTSYINNYTYNEIENITTYKVTLDLYHYNDSGIYKTITHYIQPREVTFSNNIGTYLMTKYEEIYTFKLNGNTGNNPNITVTMDGQVTNLTTKHPIYIIFKQPLINNNTLVIDASIYDISTDQVITESTNVTLYINHKEVTKINSTGSINLKYSPIDDIYNITIKCSDNPNYTYYDITRIIKERNYQEVLFKYAIYNNATEKLSLKGYIVDLNKTLVNNTSLITIKVNGKNINNKTYTIENGRIDLQNISIKEDSIQNISIKVDMNRYYYSCENTTTNISHAKENTSIIIKEVTQNLPREIISIKAEIIDTELNHVKGNMNIQIKLNGKTIINPNTNTSYFTTTNGIIDVNYTTKLVIKSIEIISVKNNLYKSTRANTSDIKLIKNSETVNFEKVTYSKNTGKLTIKANLKDIEGKVITKKTMIIIKVNGKTLQDDDNNPIYFTVNKGIIDISTTVKVNTMQNITIVTEENDYYYGNKNTTTNIKIIKDNVTINFKKVTYNKNTEDLTIKANLEDPQGNLITTSMVMVVKVNQKTLQDANNNPIYFTINKGIIDINTTIKVNTMQNITIVTRERSNYYGGRNTTTNITIENY